MSDPAMFFTGSLFTSDYLVEAIAGTADYIAVDVAGLRGRLNAIASPFPQHLKTNESQTEDDFWCCGNALAIAFRRPRSPATSTAM